MFHSFFKSEKWALWAYGGSALILAMIYLQVQLSVAFNSWYGDFYDLLQKSDNYTDKIDEGLALFHLKLISLEFLFNDFDGTPSFAVIVFPMIFLGAFLNWFTRIFILRWREAMTFGYLPRWQSVTVEIEGASQRIQEDCFRFARILELLGVRTIHAFLTLIAFIPLLWGLSSKVDVPYLKDIEGSLVWVALIVSIGGLIISWFVGYKLPGLEYNNQKIEAAFRKELVLAEDNKVDYAQTETIVELFLGIRFNYHKLYLHYSYFDLWAHLYGQIMIIVPYLIIAPSLFSGLIALGVMVQVSNAFGKVHNGFSVFIDNWTVITELRSIHLRLSEFEENLRKHETPQEILR
ncbi:putative transporter [Kiloniella antarctica]|uniref:Transporter n=1 Tax=Kiloniella antarctica TaxID=1550907 RepID=A0ABW5BEX9_9PROT